MKKFLETTKAAWSWFFGYNPSTVAKVIGFRLLEVVLVLSFIVCGVGGVFVAFHTKHYWVVIPTIITTVIIVRLIYQVDVQKDDWEYDNL